MAFCPKCSGSMEAALPACPHCGYDFSPPPDTDRKGFAYSPLADIALIVGSFVALLGCVVALIATIVGLVKGDFLTGLVIAPIAFFTQLALVVVFARVQHY